MAEVEFVGGPFDGLKLKSGLGAALSFLWTDGRRCYRAPTHARVLYRGVGSGRLFRFVGHTHALCVCGVYRRRRSRCAMCGADETLA